MKAFIKALALVLALIMACSAFAACTGDKKTPDTNGPDSPDTDQPSGDQPGGDSTTDQPGGENKDDEEFDMVREEDVRETEVSA